MIAYLLKKFPRLSETFVLNEILGQEAQGKRLHVFSRRPPDAEPRHPQFANLRATVEVLPQEGELDPWRLIFDPPPGVNVDLQSLAPVVREIMAGWNARTGKLVSEAVYLLSRCSQLGVRHVHVHFATESAVVAMLMRALGGPTYSVTAHAKDIYRSTVEPGMLGRIIANSEFTVTVCDANVEHLRAMLPKTAMQRVRRLYNGIDLGLFGSGTEAREPATILSVGRLVPKKGFDVFLHALVALRARGVRFRGCIVGTGEEEASLHALAKELGLEDSVEFTGALDQIAVRERLARATVFCLPCRLDEDGNRDALPTVLLEALAAGVPIVSTRVTGIPEILDGGRVGVLVEPGVVEPVAGALERLLADPEQRERYARAGREWAARHFDGQKAAQVLAGWFDAVRAAPVRS